MMELSFERDLDDAQVEVALKIAKKASEMGIDPKLAVSVAYQESRLRPTTGPSRKGALGVMQVMPNTGKDFGVGKEELMDPDTNIDIGVKYLKKMLDKFPEDPRLAIVAYNAGPNHAFFTKNGELPEETKNYVRELTGYGAFGGGAPTMTEEDVEEPGTEEQAPIEQPAGDGDVNLAQGVGAAVGYKVGDIQSRRPPTPGVEIPAEPVAPRPPVPGVGQMTASPFVAPGAGPASPSGGPMTRPTGGTGTENWGKAFGLGDIEASRATAMGNAPGSADELIKARAAALQRLQGMAPASGMMEDPTRGGLMVPRQTPYTGPRGPQGEIGGGRPPPVTPVTPKPAGALEEVTTLFRKMASAPLLRRVLPIAGGALSAGDALRAVKELEKPEPDVTEAALSGAGALGGALSMFPATAPVGIPLSVGSQAARFARDRAKENEALGYRPDVIPSNPMGDYGF